MERLAIHDEQLAVVPHQIVGCPAHHDAGIEHPRFEDPQALLTARVGVRNQRPNRDSTLHRRVDGLFERPQIEAEDDEVDRLLRSLNG